MAPLVVLALVGAAAVAASRRPDPAKQQRRDRARALRQAADKRLVREWIAIARNPWNPLSMRRNAWKLAVGFKKIWLDTGRSGTRLPNALSLRIYGNWCGPGYGSGACIDAIDCACRTHDLAYDEAAAIEDGLA